MKTLNEIKDKIDRLKTDRRAYKKMHREELSKVNSLRSHDDIKAYFALIVQTEAKIQVLEWAYNI